MDTYDEQMKALKDGDIDTYLDLVGVTNADAHDSYKRQVANEEGALLKIMWANGGSHKLGIFRHFPINYDSLGQLCMTELRHYGFDGNMPLHPLLLELFNDDNVSSRGATMEWDDVPALIAWRRKLDAAGLA